MFPHKSVLLHECCQVFKDQTLKVFVDGTLGAGGHSEAILRAHPEIEHFIAIDQDPVALEIAKERLKAWESKITFIHGNFSDLSKHLKSCQVTAIDGMMLDLGVSSMQLDQAEKGFSFMRDGPLDMRMNPTQGKTAADLVNGLSEGELAKIFRDYGEEKHWRLAARLIAQARLETPLLTTSDLVRVLQPLFGFRKKGGIHPLTLIFQALRIAVNEELRVLETVLPQMIRALSSTARACIISFHSLEDRIVKNFFRQEASDKHDTTGLGGGLFLDKEPEVKLLTRKPIVPSETEMEENPRSRSAKLRVIEKL